MNKIIVPTLPLSFLFSLTVELMKKHFAAKIYYNLACEQSLQRQVDKAFESLYLSLNNGWKDYGWMQQYTHLAPLRE